MNTLRVLIADDDPQLVDVLTRRCRSIGLEVDTASDALVALRMIEAHRPDVAILDVEMPSGSGIAVCEMMAHHATLKQTPVIVLTGKKDPNTIQRCHELCAYYVTKCQDVWPRIRPLLEELLDLPTTPMDRRDPAATVDAGGHAPPIIVKRGAEPDMMDAVFAALGFNEEYLEESGEDSAALPPVRPWVLCIDDAEFSLGLQLRLQEKGVDVLRAFAGREGYRCAFTSPAQAIILDYELPEGNGDYVLRRLKENPVTQHIPVIVLTGKRDRQLERQMYSLGAAAYMTKPYDWAELWRELRRFVTLEESVCDKGTAVLAHN